MMQAWSFAAQMIDELARLLRSMGKHRYVREADLRIHWAVDATLADLPAFSEHAARFESLRRRTPDLAVGSRDPRLWRPATVDDLIGVLTAFWSPDDRAIERRQKLVSTLEAASLPLADHAPFESDPESPPFPELLVLDWVFLPVDELDTERHAGVLAALEDAQEEVSPSEPVYVEGPCFSVVELCEGAPLGILAEDPLFWADGPYAYVDYVFRGISRAAKLEEPPVGPRDEDDEVDEEDSLG